jgi:imidazolonepropionase-like amidohydrolase
MQLSTIHRRLFSQILLSTFVAGTISHSTLVSGSDQIPGPPQKQPILIQNATVHTVSGGTLANHCVLLRDGKIAEIAPSIATDPSFEILDATGKHLYPGLIDSYSYIGLVEIDSVSATVDHSETGTLNPNVRAVAAFNPDSEAIPVARANGVLFSLISPTGGLVSGRSAIMQLDGWTWEDMTVRGDIAMAIQWPRFGNSGGRGRGRGPQSDPSETESGDRLAPLHSLIRETKAYALGRQADPKAPIDLRLEAMLPVVQGKTPVMIQANSIKQIQTAVAFCNAHQLKMILFGGADALHCAPLLREANIPVVLSGVYRLPNRRDAGYDSVYALPGQLQAAGVRFSIASDGRFGASGVRNLPYHASVAVGFGLDPEVALRAITLSAAEIYGVADRIGSIQNGKDASVFLSNGNILETESNVERAWIQGRRVDLSSRHTDLYNKYKVKYEQLPKP